MTGLGSRKQDRLPSRQPERRRRNIPGGGTVVPRRLQTAPAGTLFLVRDFTLASEQQLACRTASTPVAAQQQADIAGPQAQGCPPARNPAAVRSASTSAREVRKRFIATVLYHRYR